MTVTDVRSVDIWALYNTALQGANPTLADDNEGELRIVLRNEARSSGWYILVNRIDLIETYPGGSMTEAQAQVWADQVNRDRAQASAALNADEG
jgi:hypothetical protein